MSIVEDSKGPSSKVVLASENASCEVYLFGAHVTSYKFQNKERLWMSSQSSFDGSAPIRGGVPIAFPQFADEGDLKLHGFARESMWTVDTLNESCCVLKLTDSAHSRDMWPHIFEIYYTVELLSGGSSLSLSLKIVNKDEKSFSFTCCLHSYFLFHSTSKVRITGLGGTDFIDKVDGRKIKKQEVEDIFIEQEANSSGGYVDRIYLNSGNFFELKEEDGYHYKVSQSSSFTDTTLYNPWLGDKQGPDFPDFDDDGYKKTICLEPTLSKEHKAVLAPGEEFNGKQLISCSE